MFIKLKSNLEIFTKAILAGLCIGVGGTILLSLKDGSLFGSVCGALFFSLGLLTIVLNKLYLYTGKIGYLFHEKASYLITIIITWFGNFLGTFLVAFPLRFTRVGSQLIEKASILCDAKLNDSVGSIFLLSVFCGMLMYIAVNGFKTATDGAVKALIIVLPVTVFILCGFEHVIANMFYFSLASSWSLKTFAYIAVMTIGNAVGGIGFDALLTWQNGFQKK